MKRILAAFAQNTVFANIVLLIVLMAGGMASYFMIRENFPEFSLDMVVITIAYPGADPEEVEEGINRKIEEALEGTEGIKLYTTTSNEGFASAWIEIKEGYDTSEVLDDIRTRVNAISTFPVDAEKPVIRELTIKDPVVLLYLSGDMSERRIKEWSNRIKEELGQMPEISQVSIFGDRDYEINIEISEERLREYGLSIETVVDAIRRNNLNLAGGTIRTEAEEIRLRTIGRKYTGRELAKIVVMARPTGEIITLGRLAKIKDGFTEDPVGALINGIPSIMLIVYKTKEEDSLKISAAVNRYVSQKQLHLPQGAHLNILYDNTQMLNARISLLTRNGCYGLIIVFVLLWMFLNARLSFWSGMGIPISVAGALSILWAIGGTINMISLFGLIMVLGIIVDDAIVVGEAIFVHRQQGALPLKAAVDGLMEVGLPVIAAVLTTVVAFIPLFFIGGVMGKFIAVMPAVVIACLLISLMECLFLLPSHLSHLPEIAPSHKRAIGLLNILGKVHQKTSSEMEWFIKAIYRPFLSKALYYRYIAFCISISTLLITVGLVAGGILKFEVFPEVDGFVMTSTVEFPNGTPDHVTKEAISQIDAALLRLEARTKTISGKPMIKNRLALIGETFDEMGANGPHVGAVQAILIDSEERGVHTKDLMVAWEKEIDAIAGIKSLKFSGLQHGPPGDPIEVWLQGHDMQTINAAAQDLMERLKKFDGVYQIRSDYAAGKNEIRLALKPEARTMGVTVDDLARQVFGGYYGYEALRLQRGEDDIRVKVRYTEGERTDLSHIKNIRVRTRNGLEVPLLSVADISFGPGFTTITRTNGLRRVTVSAGLDTNKANANEISQELSKNFFKLLKRKYHDLHISLQGEQKKMRESFNSLKVGFPLAVFGIFIIVATMFRSYTQPFVIMFTVPFGIIGAIWGHLLLGYQLSIMSIFGMVALTGVVVNDAIVLIERINENLAEGLPFFEAILKGGTRRFRAIMLTSLSTVGGLMPLILETDLQARFLIPMALSIAAGVAFATVLTLVLIPCLLVILNDLRLLLFWLRYATWPQRVAVEPACNRQESTLKINLAAGEKAS